VKSSRASHRREPKRQARKEVLKTSSLFRRPHAQGHRNQRFRQDVVWPKAVFVVQWSPFAVLPLVRRGRN
jgi:hypothetical protein